MPKELKPLEIDRSDFELHFEMGQDSDFEVYLDKETGDLIIASDDNFDDMLDDNKIEFAEDSDRYALLPYQNSDVGYRDMEDFIETVEDEFLYKLLSVAISGPGAFRRFKDVLIDYPEAKKEWFAFKDERLEERMVRWLRSEGIEPIFT